MAWVTALERVSLDELLQRHRDAIHHLRSEIADALNEFQQPGSDDVWLLRYVLSYSGRLGDAAEAARKALRWRAANTELIEAAAARKPPPHLDADALRAIGAFYATGYCGITARGDPVHVIKASGCNLSLLMDHVGEEGLERWLNYVNECVWQYCDAATRRRRYFVKQINLVDLEGVQMKREGRFFSALGRSSKTNEWLRPQLIGKTVGFHPPVWLKMIYGIAASFMSPRSVEKTSVHKGRCDGALCPFARQLLRRAGGESLPTFLGGHGGELGAVESELWPALRREAIPTLQPPAHQVALRALPLASEEDGDSDDAPFFTPSSSPLRSPQSGELQTYSIATSRHGTLSARADSKCSWSEARYPAGMGHRSRCATFIRRCLKKVFHICMRRQRAAEAQEAFLDCA